MDYILKGKKYKVIGKAPVMPENLDVLALQKQSYARFLKKLPGLVGSRFPVEVERNGKTYRIDVRNIRVAADLSADGWKDEDSYTRPLRECTHGRETLSYNLDADIRLYVDGRSVAAFPGRHLFQFPAMTPRASFIFGGRELALKIERSEDGGTFMGPGEILQAIISTTDMTSSFDTALPRIVEEAVRTGSLDLRLDVLARDIAKIPKRPGTIPVDKRNPLSVMSSLNTVHFPFTADGTASALSNQGEYNLADLLFVSSVAKKEGADLLLNGHVTMFAMIDDDGKLRVPVHVVRDGRVTDEVVRISQDDLLSGKTICGYIPPGESVKPDTGVVSYGKKRILTGEGQVVDSVDRRTGDASEVGLPDYAAINPWAMMSVNEYVNCFALNCNPTRNAMGIAHGNQAQRVDGLGRKRVRSLDDEFAAESVQAYLTSPADGTVEQVNDTTVTIKTDSGRLVKVGLDDYMSDRTGTDQRYTPVVSTGDRVTKGQLVADGPFTKEMEVCYGVPDGICAVIPFTASKSMIDGEVIEGVGGSSNNDGIVISASFAEKLKRSGVHSVSLDLKKTAKGYGILRAPAGEDGNPDPRFDPETGLPVKGAVFRYGDTVLEQMIPDITSDASRISMAAGDDGRFVSATKMNRDVSGVVREVVAGNGHVDVIMDYTRGPEPGDKLVLGYGQKAVIVDIVPDDAMPKALVNGKTETVDMCIDPILAKRAPVALMLEGHIAMALKETGSYGIADIMQNDAALLAARESLKAGLPEDGMFRIYMPDGKGGYSKGFRAECFCPYVTLNDKEAMDQRSKDLAKGVSLDREGLVALYEMLDGNDALLRDLVSYLQSNEKIDTALLQMGVKAVNKRRGEREM